MQYKFALILLLAGCAEGAPAGDTPDAGNNSSQNTPDMSTSRPDMSTPRPDMNTGCGVCCPGERSCADDKTVQTCKSDGSGFAAAPCVGDETCSNGACAIAPLCVAGAKSCYDSTTVLTCRQTQDGYTTSPCGENTSCVDGNCVSGAAMGAVCTGDAECATGNCHCDMAEGCPAGLQGYCTTRTCTAESCGRDGVCFAASVAPLGILAADYDHCVSRCTPGTCPDGQECITLPVRTPEGIGWELGCYFPGFAGIGDDCTSNADCIGGACLVDYFNTGYCTRDCKADGVCPSDAACVALIAGQNHCSLLCGDGSIVNTGAKCPLDLPSDRFDVTCRNLSDLNNQARRVCASP